MQRGDPLAFYAPEMPAIVCARACAQYFDLDGSGTIDKGELRGLLKALCIPSNELEVSFACAPPRDRD